jgi:Dopa 4,5-dioxygenase family
LRVPRWPLNRRGQSEAGVPLAVAASIEMGTNVKDADAARPRDPWTIKHYHAHIYYDPLSSRDEAARLREQVAAAFPSATLGRWHDARVGPHPQSMYQIAFSAELLAPFSLADAQPRWLDCLASSRDRRRLRGPYRPRSLVRPHPTASIGHSESRPDGIPSYLRCPPSLDTSASTTRAPRPRTRA